MIFSSTCAGLPAFLPASTALSRATAAGSRPAESKASGFAAHPRNVPGQRVNRRFPGNEIRLEIELDNRPIEATDKNGDESLGGDPAGFLGRLGKPLLAQPVDRRFDFAPCLAEGILAIHH